MSGATQSDENSTALSQRLEAAPRHTLLLLLAAALLHALAYLCWLPPWMGEDEPWQLEYAHHVAAGELPLGGGEFRLEDQQRAPLSQLELLRRFPELELEQAARVQAEILSGMRAAHFWQRVDWAPRNLEARAFDQVAPGFSASNHPPLLPLLAAPLLCSSTVPETQLWLGRGLVVLLHLCAVAACWCAARALRLAWQDALLVALVAAWWPVSVRAGVVFNNDALAKAMGSWTLALALRQVCRLARPLEWVLLLACALGGLAAKTTAAGPALIALLALLLESPRQRGTRLALLLLLAGLPLAVWFWLEQHSPALPRNFEALGERLARGLSAAQARELLRSSVGAFSWYSRSFPDWIYWCFLAALLGLVAGSLGFARGLVAGPTRRGLLLCLAAVLLQLALIAARGSASARYLLPALPAVCALVAVGALGWCRPHARERARQLLLGALVLFDLLYLVGGVLIHEYLEWSA